MALTNMGTDITKRKAAAIFWGKKVFVVGIYRSLLAVNEIKNINKYITEIENFLSVFYLMRAPVQFIKKTQLFFG